MFNRLGKNSEKLRGEWWRVSYRLVNLIRLVSRILKLLELFYFYILHFVYVRRMW